MGEAVFGIDGPEFLVILIVIAVVAGPEEIVKALRGLRTLITTAHRWSARLREETSADMHDVALPTMDWSAFDLREYDPREMIRTAVHEEMQAWTTDLVQHPANPARSPAPPSAPGSAHTPPPVTPAPSSPPSSSEES